MSAIEPIDGIGIRRVGEPVISSRGPRAMYSWQAGSANEPPSALYGSSPARVEPSGNSLFGVVNTPVPVGDTGMTVTVRDLHISPAERLVTSDSVQVSLPTYVERGRAEIVGTDSSDTIDISQDDAGNTVLEATVNSKHATVNLGAIAELTILAGNSADLVSVAGRNYFGGVAVDAGDGNDLVQVNAVNAFDRGVVVSGGAGNDRITLTGSGMAALVGGGAGEDTIDISDVQANVSYTPTIYGNDGNDVIWGSEGTDHIYAGAGDDTVLAFGANDHVWGDAGNDSVFGYSGDDYLRGGEGDDILRGAAGLDRLYGEAGNDYLYAYSGRDQMTGGAGTDTFAPLLQDPRVMFARSHVGNYLDVVYRHENKSQYVISPPSDYWQYGKFFQDYDSVTDYLVDRRFLR